MLEAFSAPGRFYKGNLHTHSTRSDGARDPAEVCALYREAGYDFLSLTDHFLAKYDFPITDTTPFRTGSFTTLIGAELHAPATGLGEFWHILANGLPPDFATTAPTETGPALAARAAAAGAFVTIVHPAWYGLTPLDAESILPHAHAIEVYNHTSAVRTDRGDGTGLLDALLVRGHRLTALATDDAHLKCNDAFGAWVMVKAEELSPGALLHALKAGHYYATQGPAIHGIAVHADGLTVTCSAATAVIILGRGSASDVVLGNDLTQATLPLAPVRKGGYGRIVVVDAQARHAWSNPFWL
jgi:hypothetical protein